MHVFKYQNQRIRRIGEKNGKSFKVVSKAKKKKKKKNKKKKKKKKKNTWRVSWFSLRLSFYYLLLIVKKCLEKCLLLKYLLNFKDSRPNSLNIFVWDVLHIAPVMAKAALYWYDLKFWQKLSLLGWS